MIGIAAGLSTTGLIPFPATLCCFASRRVFDQFDISGNQARRRVELAGTDAGVAAIIDGGTHMSFEDVGLMRNIPRITIYEPSDPVSSRQMLIQAAYRPLCSDRRLFRNEVRPLCADDEDFELGKGKVLVDGEDVAILATGALLVPEALAVATTLLSEGISASVIDIHTVKPIDEDLVVTQAKKRGTIVTCENQQVRNGLGIAVAEVLVEKCPATMARIGSQGEFGAVGMLDCLRRR